jgi:outer membrane protein OmpA-like peptidoglycan-associated protein
MYKLFSLILIIFLFTGLSLADGTKGKVAFGLNGGCNTYFGDINDRQIKLYGNASLFLWVSDYVAIGFNGGKGILQAEKDGKFFKNEYYNALGLIKCKLFPSSPVNPYIAAGFEAVNVNPKDKNGFNLQDDEGNDFKKDQFAIPFGAGFSFFLIKDLLAVDLEGLYHYGLFDYVDGIEKGSKKDGYASVTLGLSIYFGKAKDTDGDGIPDKRDADPLRAEDFDGFEDTDGAPDLDNDMDGVPDVQDKAPLDPEDRDGFQDNDGVPDPDNDGDGIPDKDDKCPGSDETVAAGTNTMEDFDGFQDKDGCPDPDNDNDGVLDEDDKCPDEPETINEYKDDDGCPDTKPEIDVGEAIVLEGVNFSSGSSKLTQNSKRILDKVVKTMKDNKELEVEIRGYTDNTGSYNGNMKISQRRADSVRDYLVLSGIRPSRVQARGYGPESPIAPNNTSEGRAKNRRIEFFRIK